MAGGSDDEMPKASPPIGTGGPRRNVRMAKARAAAQAIAGGRDGEDTDTNGRKRGREEDKTTDRCEATSRDDKGTGNANSRDYDNTGKATSRDDWNFFKYEDEKRRQDYTTRYGPIPDPRAHPQGIQDGYDAVYRVLERRGHHIWHDTDLTVYIITRREKPKSTNPDRTDKEKAKDKTKDRCEAASRDDKGTGEATGRDEHLTKDTCKATSSDDDALTQDMYKATSRDDDAIDTEDGTWGQLSSGSKGTGDGKGTQQGRAGPTGRPSRSRPPDGPTRWQMSLARSAEAMAAMVRSAEAVPESSDEDMAPWI